MKKVSIILESLLSFRWGDPSVDSLGSCLNTTLRFCLNFCSGYLRACSALSGIWLFWDLMDCSLPGSSIYRISQARMLERLPYASPGDLLDLGIEPTFPALADDSLPLSQQGNKYLENCYFVNWDIFDVYHHVSLRYTICWFDTLIYCTIIPITVLTNTCITSQVYHFFVVLIEI